MIIDRTLTIRPVGFQTYNLHYYAGNGGAYRPLRIVGLHQLSEFLEGLEIGAVERKDVLEKLAKGMKAELEHLILPIERAVQLGLA